MSVTITGSAQVIEVTGGTGVVTTNVWKLARIRWVSASAQAGDTLIVKDTAGFIIFESEATGADWSDEVELGKSPGFLGIKIDTLTGNRGNIYFYLR